MPTGGMGTTPNSLAVSPSHRENWLLSGISTRYSANELLPLSLLDDIVFQSPDFLHHVFDIGFGDIIHAESIREMAGNM